MDLLQHLYKKRLMKFKILPEPNNLKHFMNKCNQIWVKDHICTYIIFSISYLRISLLKDKM